MGKKILITGVNGYIGRQLAWYLDKEGHEVSGYDIHIGKDLKPLLKATKYEDVVDVHFDAVVHLAAVSSVPAFNDDPINSLIHSLNALYDALQIKTDKFVFASSAAVTVLPSKRSDYGRMKSLCEDILSKHCKSPFAVLRFHNVAGCIPKSGFVENHEPETHLIPNMVLNKSLTIYGDGSQIRDYVHVEDVCRAVEEACLDKDETPLWTEVGTGIGSSVIDVIRTYNEVTGSTIAIEFLGERTGDVDSLVSYPPDGDTISLYTIIQDTICGYAQKGQKSEMLEKEVNGWI